MLDKAAPAVCWGLLNLHKSKVGACTLIEGGRALIDGSPLAR